MDSRKIRVRKLGRTLVLLGITVISVVILSVFVVMAYTPGFDDQGNFNDPAINPRANACYDGGTMEGKCDTEWEYNAGWYLIRFEYGIITRNNFPAEYASVLPSLVQITPAGMPTSTALNTATSLPDATPSDTPTNTPTATASDTATNMATATSSNTPTNTATATSSNTSTNTATATSTPS